MYAVLVSKAEGALRSRLSYPSPMSWSPSPLLFRSGNFRHAHWGRESYQQNQDREAGRGSCRESVQAPYFSPWEPAGSPSMPTGKRGDWPTCSPQLLKVKTLKTKSRALIEAKREAENFYIQRFWAKMEGWKEQNKKKAKYRYCNLFLLGTSSTLTSPHCLVLFSGFTFGLPHPFGKTFLWKDDILSFLVTGETLPPGKLM